MADYTGKYVVRFGRCLWYVSERRGDLWYLADPRNIQGTCVMAVSDLDNTVTAVFTTEKAAEVWAALQGVDLL